MSTQTPIPVGTSATQWARRNGDHFTWSAAADRYSPPRTYLYGEGWHYEARNGGGRAIVLEIFHGDCLDRDAFYLYDDTRAVRAYYVAGWNDDSSHLVLHELPTNYDENGERKMRPDGRPVDHAVGGGMGRRMAFHVQAVTDEDRLEVLEAKATEATRNLALGRQRWPGADLGPAMQEADEAHRNWQAMREDMFQRRQHSGRWPNVQQNGRCAQWTHHHAGDFCLNCGNDER